ncbi:MAG: hypothetical protein WCF84_16460 [Anaerolineae bacterium]
MTDSEIKELCLSLIRADTEQEVIRLLSDARYWDDRSLWQFYGGYENNFNTIGNQQSRPDAALIEKLVNSVDARLMNECLTRGIDPEGPQAPQTTRQAVGQFFDPDIDSNSDRAGRISEWSNDKRKTIAEGITLTATGAPPREGKPCFTISDCGEGQTPAKMPDTFLSLTGSNKLRIPFVQGKFNMGGTGILRFCGRHNLQLIVSRRNPDIKKGHFSDPTDDQWGFTIVRREDPKDGRRSSVYTYLAPMPSASTSKWGGVLRFSADSLPIFPEGRDPYVRESEWGTLVKLYEYSASGYSNTHILLRDGLLSRIDILLPDVGLPIRLHECRPSFRGHEGSFETTLAGLRVRLEDGKGDNLEEGFPSSSPLSVEGEQMRATIYAFKKDRAETYRKNEGIIFTLNGQTQGNLTKDFFTRKNAGRLNYIADSILVMVDCSKFSGRAREDLFINSRDRLSGGELRNSIEHALEELLKNHSGLRALKERRRREEIESKLDNSKPLEEVLQSLLKQSPVLAELFLRGQKLSNPFKTIKVQSEEKVFEGKQYPTYFKFKDKEYGIELHRDSPINKRSRIIFETDAISDYFEREANRGDFSLYMQDGTTRADVANYVGPNLHNGMATLTLQLPDTCHVGDVLRFTAIVTDRSRVDPFENVFTITVKQATEEDSVGQHGTKRHRTPTKEHGKDREVPAGISLPPISEVYEKDWGKKNPPFDQYTALRIRPSDINGENGEEQVVYDFHVNMDNFYLRTELKLGDQEPEVNKARFKYALVLLGLALLHEEQQERKAKREGEESDSEMNNETEERDIEKKSERFSRALAPFLLPMINSLGSLELDNIRVPDSSGEDT